MKLTAKSFLAMHLLFISFYFLGFYFDGVFVKIFDIGYDAITGVVQAGAPTKGMILVVTLELIVPIIALISGIRFRHKFENSFTCAAVCTINLSLVLLPVFTYFF